MNDKYDHIGKFYQGVAIVIKNDKYGAIMIGGKEIVPPIYEELSEFKDGYAVAKWNNEERVVNLSGQVRVSKDGKEIYLPEEYDWGFNFIEDICVVVKNGKYGIIDSHFNVKLECEYDTFSDYHKGFAIFSKDKWSKCTGNVWSDNLLIDSDGKVQYELKESFSDGHKIVCCADSQQKLYGVMNSDMRIIIPIMYSKIVRLKNDLYIADSEGDAKLFLDPEDGKLIDEKVVDEIVDLSKSFFCTYREIKEQNVWETCIYTSPESPQFCIHSKYKVYFEINEIGNAVFHYSNLKYRYDLKGDLYIIAKASLNLSVSAISEWRPISERKVKLDYLKYNHKPFSEKYEIIEDSQNRKGLSDLVGNILIEPQYKEIHPFIEEMFIASKISETGNSRKFGVVDIHNNIKISFTFNYLIPINEKFLAYTDDEVNVREGYRMSLPSSTNSYYRDIRFGIIDIGGKKLTKPVFHQITYNIDNTVFIITEDGAVGLIDCKGKYILNPKYNTITYNQQTGTFTTGIHNKTNDVSFDGYYLVKDYTGDIVKVPAQLVDWCSDFSEDGIACVIRDGHSGHINKFNQFVSFIDGKELIMPSRYDFIKDFTNGYAPVLLQGRFGLVNNEFKLIIPCKYEYIEALSDSLFKFREGSKWGLTDASGTVIAKADYVSIVSETENLLKAESYVQNGSSRESRYGFLDCKGNVIIPAECKAVTRVEQGDNIFFVAEKALKKGVLDKNGNIIVPFIYNYISEGGSPFYCVCHNMYDLYGNDIHSFYKHDGERYICIYIDKDCCQSVTIPAGYEYAAYAGCGLVKVSQAGKWGLIDISGNNITEPQYTSIDVFDGQFAKVAKCEEENKYKYGLIDTVGEVVLPIEYEEIKRWDNGYYVVRKDGLYGLLSPSLHMAIEPNRKYLKKLNDKYILEMSNSDYPGWYNLIDYYGNRIISRDACGSFINAEELENGFLKVLHYKSEYNGGSRIGIYNSTGKLIYDNDNCDDITYFGDNLFLVKGFLYSGRGLAGHDIYRIVNCQGEVLLDNCYDYIEFLKNGNFLICKNHLYGLAKLTGEIIIQPKYKNKISFENGFAKIRIECSDQEHKIDADGYVFLLDSNKNEIRIPRDYYWGTDFIHGISIVRATDSYGNDTVGVINEAGEVIIHCKYDMIKLLSDNTLLVKKDNKYGLYDINGKCILPDIFTTVEHISEDRIRVVWNLKEVQSWSPGKYIPNLKNDLGSRENYLVNDRSALCDTKGNVLSDKRFVWIGKYLNGYARCHLNIEAEKGKIKFKNAGIVDTNGKTIVNPEYDGIILYNHPYARLRKGNKYGIADLNNNKTIFFDEINIKKPVDIDPYGRFTYIDGDYHNEMTNNKGVMGPNGIILYPGKYYHIDLLENGLIKVSNKEKTLLGLLSVDGKELLKMEFSYISQFKYGHASVCIGGHEENKYPYRHVGGKWGIIDKTGKFIIECIHDQRQALSANDIIRYNLIDDTEFDSYGRLLYVGPGENKSQSETTIQGIGVIGLKGIIVPVGQYQNIELLENGLMMVSDKQKGLLGADGRELLEMKYSYISSFENGYASICVGGHKDWDEFEHIGGKWGIIDKTGKFIIECDNDKEEIEKLYKTILIDSSVISECSTSKVLCSDCIPSDIGDDDYKDCYDEYYSGGDDDDTPSIYDNPYYNDNIDMDQQSIEFWNSL